MSLIAQWLDLLVWGLKPTSYTLFAQSQNNLDCNLDRVSEDVHVYTGHSVFNTTKRITLLFIVQSLLYRNPPNIWIKIIKIQCLHRTEFLCVT